MLQSLFWYDHIFVLVVLYFNIMISLLKNVSVKQKGMALKLAPVIMFIWVRVPQFGTIFLAQLFRNCPYAVPFYPSREDGQSEVEYMIICGYQLNSEGKITEKDELYLERMFIMIELYSAVIQCNITQCHPRNLQYAWNWLARVLNEKPVPKVTALMLDAFLSMSAHKLLRIYGKQFVKVIHHIKSVYLKKIESITTTDKQTMMKLITLIDDIYRIIMTATNSLDAASALTRKLDIIPDNFFL